MPVRGMKSTSCVRRVQVALESVPGVMDTRVDLAQGRAMVSFDLARITVAILRGAIEAAGYGTGEPVSGVVGPTAAGTGTVAQVAGTGSALRWPILFGLSGCLLLLSLYLGLVTLAQGFGHATELLQQDWYLVVPIALGFGIQVGLFFLHAKQPSPTEGNRLSDSPGGRRHRYLQRRHAGLLRSPSYGRASLPRAVWRRALPGRLPPATDVGGHSHQPGRDRRHGANDSPAAPPRVAARTVHGSWGVEAMAARCKTSLPVRPPLASTSVTEGRPLVKLPAFLKTMASSLAEASTASVP